MFSRSPFLEMEGMLTQTMIEARRTSTNTEDIIQASSVDYTKKLKSPRVIKSHLPLDMLPPKLLDTCKVIFVCRNPKDCCVSYYHHHLNIPKYGFRGSFGDFAISFLDGSLEYGSYWTMVKVSKNV